MIVVHHLNASRSQRVLWLLEELGVPYEVKRYQRDPKTMLAPPELRAVHPLGKSPVITDGGTTLAETGAILEYLLGTYGKGKLKPAEGTPEHLRYTYFLHYGEGSLMPLMVMGLVFSGIAKGPMPFFVRPIAKRMVKEVRAKFLSPQVKLHLGFLESELAKSTWFAGDELTGADILMSFPVEAAAARVGLGASYPRLAAFLDRIHGRPAYQRALTTGGPFELLR